MRQQGDDPRLLCHSGTKPSTAMEAATSDSAVTVGTQLKLTVPMVYFLEVTGSSLLQQC